MDLPRAGAASRRNGDAGMSPRRPPASSVLLRPHIGTVDAGDDGRLLHRVPPEGLAELLVEDDLDEGRHAALLGLARLPDGVGQFLLRPGHDALEAASVRDFRVAELRVELRPDAVVAEQERVLALS